MINNSLYSIAELKKKIITNYRIISNPGCYPTSIQLALYPLIKKKLIKFYIINPDFENFEEFRTLINSLTICDDYPNGLLEQED